MELETPARTLAAVHRIITPLVSTRRQATPEKVPLGSARGRMLAHEVTADRDQPPLDRATMDGIAVPCGAIGAGLRSFRRVGIHPAGGEPRKWEHPQESDTCIEIMTGATVPDGYDTVVRYEDLSRSGDDAQPWYSIEPDRYSGGENVHRRGADYAAGDTLIPAGVRIASTHLAVLASCGWASVPVVPRPKIAVLGTGDELVPVDRPPLPHQIRASNPWSIVGELSAWGFAPVSHAVIGDEPAHLSATIANLLDGHDIVVLCGAVSRGLYDSVPAILREQGVDILVHGVRQRPGKPLLVGVRDDTVVLGLPGNPVSSLVSLRRYLVPPLVSLFGTSNDTADALAGGIPARLTHDQEFAPPLTWYPAVKAVWNEYVDVTIVTGNGSGDFFHLVGSSGVIEIPEEHRTITAGSTVRFFPWGC